MYKNVTTMIPTMIISWILEQEILRTPCVNGTRQKL